MSRRNTNNTHLITAGIVGVGVGVLAGYTIAMSTQMSTSSNNLSQPSTRRIGRGRTAELYNIESDDDLDDYTGAVEYAYNGRRAGSQYALEYGDALSQCRAPSTASTASSCYRRAGSQYALEYGDALSQCRAPSTASSCSRRRLCRTICDEQNGVDMMMIDDLDQYRPQSTRSIEYRPQSTRSIDYRPQSTRSVRYTSYSYQCKICGVNIRSEPSITLNCKHSFHRKCLFSCYIVQTKMNGGSFQCPMSNCKAAISVSIIKSLLSSH